MQKWLDGLEEELFSQGDFEASIGLPITPFMDRCLPGISSKQASESLSICMCSSWQTVCLPVGRPLLGCRP